MKARSEPLPLPDNLSSFSGAKCPPDNFYLERLKDAARDRDKLFSALNVSNKHSHNAESDLFSGKEEEKALLWKTKRQRAAIRGLQE